MPAVILSASQPYFAPFPGFFYKAHLSDVFVILDEVQFPRGTTWISRNRFKNDQGTLWMTVPVWKKGLGLQRIKDVRICHEGRWAGKHLESLKGAYGNAPYFEEHLDFLEGIFSRRFERLIDLNLAVIRHLMGHLSIEREVARLSHLDIEATGDERLVEICRRVGATRFLAQGPAEKYLDAGLFREAGITLEFFTPPSPVYPQLWGDFIPNLSTFDLLFNCGSRARDIMLRG
jgi:hypothetical protein